MKFLAALVCALTLTLLAGSTPAVAGDPKYGRAWASDKVLRDGCHNYKYQYKVKPPTNDWSLETFLRDPNGEGIASNAFINGEDRKRGQGTFRFCDNVTSPGRFKIRGKLTYRSNCDPVGNCERHEKWIQPGYFRMRRAS